MNFLRNLLRPRPDPREPLRPLWHKVVEISREPVFYREDGVADAVAGRFDMIAAILALVMLRMERDRILAAETALLAELFVADMDRQLRETGVGDLVVGKHVSKLMSVLGGRLGALRGALASGDNAALEAALERNMTMAAGGGTGKLARRLRGFYDRISALDSKRLLAAEFEL